MVQYHYVSKTVYLISGNFDPKVHKLTPRKKPVKKVQERPHLKPCTYRLYSID